MNKMGTKMFRSRRANLAKCEDNLGMHASQPATEGWSNRAFHYFRHTICRPQWHVGYILPNQTKMYYCAKQLYYL